MRKVVHLNFVEYENLRSRERSDCWQVGDAYISFEDNCRRYNEITAVSEGYGRSNYTWEAFDFVIE